MSNEKAINSLNQTALIPSVLQKLIFSRKNYKRILNCDISEENLEYVTLINKRMSNSVGFVNNGWFKIVNLGDNSVIELDGKKLIAKAQPEVPVPLVSTPDAQRFQATLKENGYFEISSKVQDANSTVLKVWDYSPHRKALIQLNKSESVSGNQNWSSVHVPGKECTFFILSAPDCNFCLKNLGVGKQIKIVPKTDEAVGNRFAHWNLESLGPVLPPVTPVFSPVLPSVLPTVTVLPPAHVTPVLETTVLPSVPVLSTTVLSPDPVAPVLETALPPVLPPSS